MTNKNDKRIPPIERFNVRVYGIFINDSREVLLSHEKYRDREFTKFPGGGVNLGESIADALKREWLEELKLRIEIKELLYVNDFFVPSFMNDGSQVISIYYLVELEEDDESNIKKGIPVTNEKNIYHSWKPLEELTPNDLALPIDKKVAELLRNL